MLGNSLLTMQRLDKSGKPTGEILVAADTLSCSKGEIVLVTRGQAARIILGEKCPIDLAIVGIVDTYEF